MSYVGNRNHKASGLTNYIFSSILLLMLLGTIASNSIMEMNLKYKSMVNKEGRVALSKALLKEDFCVYLNSAGQKMMYSKIVILAVLCAYIVGAIYKIICTESEKEGLTNAESFNTIKRKPSLIVVTFILAMILINSYSFRALLESESFDDTDVKIAVINQDDYRVLTDMDYDNNYIYSVTLSNGMTCNVKNKLFKRVTHPGEYYFAYIKKDTNTGIVFGIYPASEFYIR